MIDHRRGEIVHAERLALHLRLVQKLGGDDHCRRPARRFQSDAVMRTARSARPSVADRRYHDVVIGRDRRDQRRVGVLGKALLAVVIDGGKGEFSLEPSHRLAQQPTSIPFGVIEHTQAQPTQAADTRGKSQRRGLDHPARIEGDHIILSGHTMSASYVQYRGYRFRLASPKANRGSRPHSLPIVVHRDQSLLKDPPALHYSNATFDDPGPSGEDAEMISVNLAMSDHRVAVHQSAETGRFG